MMKTLRALAVASLTLLLSVCATAQANSAVVNQAQRITLAGLRANAGQGKFPAAAFAPDGSLLLLYDQADGVRLLKLSASGSTILAQAQLGSAGDAPIAMALDPAGNIYVAGTSFSGTLNGTAGAAFPSRADASTNSFLAKFDPSLNLLFLTFLGSGRTAVTSVAATADSAFVTGLTFTSTFPVTPNGIQQTPAFNASPQNGFVERFSANGATLVYATYLSGANGSTTPAAIVADSADNATIAGSTNASGFPTTAALVPRIASETSGFLTSLTPAGDGFTFSTFIPGDGLTGLALDEPNHLLLLSGNIAPGQFPIASASAPLTSAAYQSLAKISTDGQSVPVSTFLVPGTQSFVSKGPSASVWITGSLLTPLFPGNTLPLALFGDSVALHVTSNGVIDQTARFGGQLAGTFSAGTLTSLPAPPAVSADGSTIALPATIGATVDTSLAAATRFDLPLVQSPNAALPTTLRNLAASCTGSGQCATSAGYLSLLSPTDGVALSISADALPNIVIRNLGSTSAQGIVLTASGYSLTSNCAPTLDPSNICVAALTGSGPGSFTVSAANAPSQTIALPGNTLAPDPLAVLPVELDFGIQTRNSTASTRTFTVTNISTATQTFSSALDSLARTLPFTFAEAATDCPTNGTGGKLLSPGASCRITLAFTVSTSATMDSAVRAAWKVGTHDIALTGYVQLTALNLSSNALDFGTHFVNGVLLPRYLYVSNNSTGAIAHTLVSVPPTSSFAVNDECPGTLLPQTVCRLTVTYKPGPASSFDSVTLALDQGLTVLVSGQTLPQQGTTASAANPNLSITPSAITFASPVVVSGVSGGTQTVTVKNSGATALPLSFSVSGDFTIQNGCPAVLAGGSSCQVLVRFVPAQPGVRNGLLVITSGSAFAPAYVTLSGTASSLFPPNNGILEVGQAYVGEPVSAYFKLQQTLPAVTLTSSNPAFRLALVEDDGSGHGSLPPSAFAQTISGSCGNCYLGIQFLSQTPGTQTATLAVTTSTGGNAYTLLLDATALAQSGLLLSPLAQDFGVVPVNSSSAPQLFTLANLLSPAASSTITSVSTTGDFRVATNTSGGATCASALAPSSSCFVQVLFAPTATGDRTGILTVVTSAGTVTASLSGFAAADPGIALNPVELDFRNAPGTQAMQQSVMISNTGTIAAAVGAITVSDPSFAATSNCSTLSAGMACAVTVTFTPGGAQTAGTLTLPITTTRNGQTSTAIYSVLLQGLFTTQNAGLQIVPEEVNFGSVAIGTISPVRQFTVNNLTAKTAQVALSLPRQFPLTGANACGMLPAFGSCTFSITYVPAVGGAATGTVVAQAAPPDGSAPLQALAYMQGYSTGNAALTLSGNLIPNSPLRFGQVTSGQTSQQTLTVTNASAIPLTVRRVHSDPPFLSTTACGTALAAGQACTITITYAPSNEVPVGTGVTAPRADTGTLTIESDASTSPDIVQLAGSVAALASSSPSNGAVLSTFTLSQGALTFSTTTTGNAAAPQTITLTNTGNTTLHVLGTTPSIDFTATSTCDALPPGGACAFTVIFSPTIASTAATRIGALEIRTDSSTPLDFVTLIGSTSAAPLTVSPTSLDFGTVNVGSGGSLSVSVTNTTTAPVTFTSVSATGDYSAANGTCPATGAALAAGATCTLRVTFTPVAAGTRTGTLSIATDATTAPLTVSLTGNAVVAKLQISPGALAFGSVTVGAPASLSVTLLNTGTAAVTAITSVLTGVNAADFAITTPCSTSSLAPNQGCTLTVTFTPSATGPRSASLTLSSSDPTSPFTIALTGSGSAPGSFTLTVDGGASATRTVKSGFPATYTLTIAPVNGFTGAVALTCAPVNPGVYASCSLDPSTVGLATGSQSAKVTINTITSASLEVPAWARLTLAWLWLPLFCARRRKGIRKGALTLFAVAALSGVALSTVLAGCGSGNGSQRFTPAGTYQYTVTGTSTSGAQITQTVTLNLTVQ